MRYLLCVAFAFGCGGSGETGKADSAPEDTTVGEVANDTQPDDTTIITPDDGPADATPADTAPVDVATLTIPEGMSVTTVSVYPSTVLRANTTRFGINVGGYHSYFMKNLIPNPGFEAGVHRSMVHAGDGSTQNLVIDKHGWAKQENGYWDGAEFRILTGAGAGRTGTIKSFTVENGYRFELVDDGPAGPAPQKDDIMIVRRTVPGYKGDLEKASTENIAPGSPGKQSLRLTADQHYTQYLDAFYRDIEDDSGKDYIVRGQWRFTGWVKGTPGDSVALVFFREKDKTNDLPYTYFLKKTVTFDQTGWVEVDESFEVKDGVDPNTEYPSSFDGNTFLWGVRPILGIQFKADKGNAQPVFVDDVSLVRQDTATNASQHNDVMVQMLKDYQPGTLRFWGGQLGQDLKQMLSPQFARGTFQYRLDKKVPDRWDNSLHDFLQLCVEVGANPWYVFPPSLRFDELHKLIEYLASPADAAHPYAQLRASMGQADPWTKVFSRIYLEYGNETWGGGGPSDPFGGASVNYQLGAAVKVVFSHLKQHPDFDAAVLNLMAPGQASNKYMNTKIGDTGGNYDSIGWAPYFGSLQTYASDEEIYQPLLALPSYTATKGVIDRNVGIAHGYNADTGTANYEINFGKIGGDSPEELRNRVVAGQVGALALPLQLLTFQRVNGLHTQCAFGFYGVCSRYNNNGQGFSPHNWDCIRVWGMVRNLHNIARKRPTYLGVELTNKAVLGSLVQSKHTGDDPSWTQAPINGVEEEIVVKRIQSFAFSEGSSRGLVLFNLDLETSHGVRLELPMSGVATADHWWIASQDIKAWNEHKIEVQIEHASRENFGNGFEMVLPPHSIHVLRWESP
jgi:alpha-L-arabinofuranosidase